MVGGLLALLRVVVIGHCGQSRLTQAVRCCRHVFRVANWLAPCLRMFQSRRLLRCCSSHPEEADHSSRISVSRRYARARWGVWRWLAKEEQAASLLIAMQTSGESPHTGCRDTWRKGNEKLKASLGAQTRTRSWGECLRSRT